MALRYTGVMLGTLTIKQPKLSPNGDHVTDNRGRKVFNKFVIQIRQCNALAAFIYVYKNEKGDIHHQLYTFFVDQSHMRNMMKDESLANKDGKHHLLGDNVVEIKLNTYHKECMQMLTLLTKDGYEVKCYYNSNEILG